jgi:hypothetical protein
VDRESVHQHRNEPCEFEARGIQECVVLGVGVFFPASHHQHLHIGLQHQQLRYAAGQNHALNQQHFSSWLHGLVATSEQSNGALIIPIMDHPREQVRLVASGNCRESISTNHLAAARYYGCLNQG